MNQLLVRRLGLLDYEHSYQAMSDFTTQRDASCNDEIWCLQHPPVYTLGLSGRREHILDAGEIPVMESDRGGQVTYHGPGQVVIYLLMNLKRRGLGIKDFVFTLEQSILDMLENRQVAACRRQGAPGVYVDDKKIAALGVRVRRSCTYHGLALNVDMDLVPFQGINPCGYPNLGVTQLREHSPVASLAQVNDELVEALVRNFYPEGCTILNKQDLNDTYSNTAA